MAILTLMMVVPFHLFIACSGNDKDTVVVDFNPQTDYTMKSTDIEHLISDSGVTVAKIITKTWLKFDRASEPFQKFPDGFYAEKFDTLLNIEAIIKADTVYYYEKRNLYEGVGNVDVVNLSGDRFESYQLFWDQNNKIIYSDTFVTVTGKDFVKYGRRFTADERLTEYRFFNTTGEFLVELNRRTNPVDSIPPEP